MFIKLNISCYKNPVIVSFMFLYGCFSNVSAVAGSSVLLVMYPDKPRAHLLWYDPLIHDLYGRGSGESSSYCSLGNTCVVRHSWTRCLHSVIVGFLLLHSVGFDLLGESECWFVHLNHVGLVILDVFRFWTGYKSATLTDPLPNSAFGHSSFNSATLAYGL